MKVVALEKTNLTLPDAAEMARGGTVILTRDGKPLAVIKGLSGFAGMVAGMMHVQNDVDARQRGNP